MTPADLIKAYNYEIFSEENVAPWMNFAGSPPVGETAPDFPLWQLDGAETSLRQIVTANRFTVVEFGSFT